MNLMSNAIMETLLGNSKTNQEKDTKGNGGIITRNYPLPLTKQETRQSIAINGYTCTTFILIAFCFLPASYAIYIVKEYEAKVKYQQIISGVSLAAYWISNYVWDLLTYIPPFLITYGLLLCIL